LDLEKLQNLFIEYELPLTLQQEEMFGKYYDLLLQWNQKANLMSRGDEKRIVERHFLESALLVHFDEVSGPQKVVDLGTGGGFPGVPLKIMQPQLEMVLLDSTRWKCLFLKKLLQITGLEHATVVCDRAEKSARESAFTGEFDLVLNRAVAGLKELYDMARFFLKSDGQMISIKGSKGNDEIDILLDAYSDVQVRSEFFPCDKRGLFHKQRIVIVKKRLE